MAYKRKTKDEYDLLIDYGHGHGYEVVVTEETIKEIRERRKEYRENEPQYPRKIKKRRVKI